MIIHNDNPVNPSRKNKSKGQPLIFFFLLELRATIGDEEKEIIPAYILCKAQKIPLLSHPALRNTFTIRRYYPKEKGEKIK